MANRDTRRAAKRRAKRKAEATVERTGPGGGMDIKVDPDGTVPLADDGETDAQLRAHIVERLG